MDMSFFKQVEYPAHKFSILILKILIESHSEYYPKEKKELYNFSNSLNYQINKVNHLIKSSEICRSEIFSLHPLIEKEKIKKSKYLKEDLIRYHIENFFLRVTVFRDIIYDLFNQVYSLNVKKGNGFAKRLRNVMNGKQKEDFETISNMLFDLTKDVQDKRNEIAHEGYFHDSDLGLLGAGEDFISKREDYHKKYNIDIISSEELMDLLKSIVIQNYVLILEKENEMIEIFQKVLDIFYNPLLDKVNQFERLDLIFNSHPLDT